MKYILKFQKHDKLTKKVKIKKSSIQNLKQSQKSSCFPPSDTVKQNNI